MVTLHDNQLSFEFPGIGKQAEALIDRRLADVIASLTGTNQVKQLLDAMTRMPQFRRLSPERQEMLRQRATSLTAIEIESALRSSFSKKVGRSDRPPSLAVVFHRTLRIPDDGKTYPLPASLGHFPLRSVDDFPETIPPIYAKRGGVMMPMYQAEALWISFRASYPCAIKIAAGKINVVSGARWSTGLNPGTQDYVVTPDQRWIDGFAVGKGKIRQFVAMPLGEGYSVEEQLTGQAETGGMQLEVYPLSAEAYYRDDVAPQMPESLAELTTSLFEELDEKGRVLYAMSRSVASASMGLGAGGRMKQEIYKDRRQLEDWDQRDSSRCFVHLCNSQTWRQLTGSNPPHPPVTQELYARVGIPWYDYYRDDLDALDGSKQLAAVKSVLQIDGEKNAGAVSPDIEMTPEWLIQFGNTRRPTDVREFTDAT